MPDIQDVDPQSTRTGQGAAESAYSHIRNSIITGALPPGETLKESDLARDIGVSRTPVREALSRLGQEGLVEVGRYRKARVATFSVEDAAEVFRLRAILEGHGAGRAASRVTADQIAELEQIEVEMEAAFRDFGWHRHLVLFDTLNMRFHALIAQIADSPRLERILASSLELPASIFNHYSESHDERTLRTHRQHREIIDALKASDAGWADAAMRGHLLSLAPRES